MKNNQTHAARLRAAQVQVALLVKELNFLNGRFDALERDDIPYCIDDALSEAIDGLETAEGHLDNAVAALRAGVV
jgi:hypothetical protein